MHNQQLSSHQLGLFNCTGAATLNCFVIGTSPPPARARTWPPLAVACAGLWRALTARSPDGTRCIGAFLPLHVSFKSCGCIVCSFKSESLRRDDFHLLCHKEVNFN